MRRTAAWIAALFVLTLAFAGSASAATYTPTQFSDDDGSAGDCPADATAAGCTLREAVKAANGTAADDVVALSAGTYELLPSLGTIRIGGADGSGALLARGAGARETIIDGNTDIENIGTRPLTFEEGSNGELRDLSVTGGNGVDCGQCFADGNGGAIAVLDGDGGDGQVLLTRVRVFGNGVDGSGGGIYNTGQLTLVQSLVDDNAASFSGGGIENEDELTLTNSTVSGNEVVGSVVALQPSSDGAGGGIHNSGDFAESQAGLTESPVPEGEPFLRAENSTIAFNEAAGNGGGVSTAIPEEQNCETALSFCDQLQAAQEGGPIARFHNTIVSDNTADGDTNCSGNQPADSGAFTSSEGHNLEDGDSCLFTAEGDLDKASGLAALANNGGGTDTHKLNDGSAAIDAAESDGCPAVDQRGTARPLRNGCDIGAFEREAAPVEEEPDEEEPQQQQPVQELPDQGVPEARGPRCLDTQPPLTRLDRDGLRVKSTSVTLSGSSHDRGLPCASGVQRVEVSMAKVSGTDLNCRFLRRSNRFVLSPFQNCRQPIRFVAGGTTQWQFKFKVNLSRGKYRAQARGYDEERNKETPKKRRNIVTFTVK